MRRDQIRDVEKGDLDTRYEEEGDAHSTESTLDPTLTKEAGFAGHKAPHIASEDFLDTETRGRSQSVQPRESHESARTQSDTGQHDTQVAAPHRSRSRARSSARSVQKEAVNVPRGERRGLFARFAVLAEVTDPYDYSQKKKWMITFVVALAASAAPMGSSIILPALSDITASFDAAPTVVNLSVAM